MRQAFAAIAAGLAGLAAVPALGQEEPVAGAGQQGPPVAEVTPAEEEPSVRLPLSDLVIDDDDPTETPAPPAAEAAPAPAAPAAPPATTATTGAAVVPPSVEERARLATAMERGRLLFAIARAAQLTTGDMLARIPDPAAAGVSGWIAEREGNGLTVIYYADGDDGPAAVYRGQVVGGRIAARDVFPAGSRPALTATQQRMAAARAAVAGLEPEPCAADVPFNVFVVAPASADAPIDVYKLTPQTRPERFPLGGHFLATVAPDGTIASTRAFANRCLDLEAAAPAPGTAGAPIAVTHHLDPLPTEIHVFLSLWSGRPLLVATGDPERVWAIGRGRIGLVGLDQARNEVPPPGPGR